MRGTIGKKGHRYYPVTEAGKDPQTGKRKRTWHQGHERLQDAEKALHEIFSSMESIRGLAGLAQAPA